MIHFVISIIYAINIFSRGPIKTVRSPVPSRRNHSQKTQKQNKPKGKRNTAQSVIAAIWKTKYFRSSERGKVD